VGPGLTVPRELLEALRSHDAFLILGHVEPDGDCIASQLVMRSMLRRLGKRASVYNAGPFKRPEIIRHLPEFAPEVGPEQRSGTVLVLILDCSTLERTGPLATQVAGLPVAVIDHHASGAEFGGTRFVAPASPSVTLMLLRVMQELGLEPTRDEADLILFGLATDTAFFRHLGAESADAFRAVAELIGAGASPQATFDEIYGGRSLEERRLLGRVLARTESLEGGRIMLCYQTREEQEQPGAAQGSSEELYRLLQTVSGVELIVLLREESGPACSVSLRSSSEADVGSVARRLGGGGHARAAGCTLQGTLAEVRRRVLDELTPLLAHAGRPSEGERRRM